MEEVYKYMLDQIPNSIDFNFITVKYETVKTFILDNISNSSILFSIENAEGFIFEPSNGVIPKQRKMEIKIKISPDYANVLVANAKITLDNKINKIIKMSSIGKYPFLHLSKYQLDFGNVQIGHSKELELIITNQESVPAKFIITKESVQPGKNPEVFNLSSNHGEIPPHSNFLLNIKYKPFFPSIFSYEIYKIKTIGGNEIVFKCFGSCEKLKTWIGSRNINFKSIELGNSMTKLIRFHNDSDIPTEFQVFHENSGVFSFDHTDGVIPAKGNVRINVTFKPIETMIYYDRIFVLTKNHSLITLDLFGSCHNLLKKNLLLSQKQIDMFRFKLLQGFYTGNKKKTKNNSFNNTISENNNNNNENNALTDMNNQLQLHKELFWENTNSNRIISVDTEFIDFNYIESGTCSEPYVINVNNNSNENVKVKWLNDKPVILSNLVKSINIFNVDSTIFFIQPEEELIPAKSKKEFKVYFKPNKTEFYFYSDLPCLGTLMTKYNNTEIDNKILFGNINNNTANRLNDINKNKLSEYGKVLTQNFESNKQNSTNTSKSNNFISTHNNNNTFLFKSLNLNKKFNKKNLTITNSEENYFDPPIPLKISLVGHSFPPSTQIFMPIFEMTPKKEIFFPPATIHQSLYQTLKIKNNNDVPLFYKISPISTKNGESNSVFRIHRKYGLIPANEFHLICLEFCPNEPNVFKVPLRIYMNHDANNVKTIMLNGLCTNPVIDIEGIRNEIYFPPTSVGIKSKKTIVIKNLSPITILVNITDDNENNSNGKIKINPNKFIMNGNMIKNIDIFMTPLKTEEIINKLTITAEKLNENANETSYIFDNTKINKTLIDFNDEKNEIIKEESKNSDFEDKNKIYKREITLLGRGSDGTLNIVPNLIVFETVKIGFHQKLPFSIFNPTITNFYIKLIPRINDDNKELAKQISLDFTEGLINSFCKKEISVIFAPTTRAEVNLTIDIFAYEHLSTEKTENQNENKNIENEEDDYEEEEEKKEEEIKQEPNEKNLKLKCSIVIKAKGDYPLIRIVDIRNNETSSSKLWKSFNVDLANNELQKNLTDEETNYAKNKNKKIEDITNSLKRIRLDFGKHIFKKHNLENYQDVYLTLKNMGGVSSEFYFKFPDDINIRREIWMDPVEPTSNDKVEYHVLKEKIFSIEPRKAKLQPNETINIRLRYNIKERGQHRLRIIFQIVNGKPLIFELFAETYSDKVGIIHIPQQLIDFSYVPIGYMDYIARPIELRNISNVKIKYNINKTQIKMFNENNDNFEIFKLMNGEGTIGPGENAFLICYFRPLTDKEYKLDLMIQYSDEANIYGKSLTIIGRGFHPLKISPPKIISPFNGMPNNVINPKFNGERIQNCGFNIEELDFGNLSLNKSKNKTFILYNFSNTNAFNFDFLEPQFLIKDELVVIPNKGLIEPNGHKIIKCVLNTKQEFSEYEGDLQVRIIWKNNNNNLITSNILNNNLKISTQSTNNKNPINQSQNLIAPSVNRIFKENLFLRVRKKCIIEGVNANIEPSPNDNSCFIEDILTELTKEILSDSDFTSKFETNIDNQPLDLFEWTSDISLPTQKETREEYNKQLNEQALINIQKEQNVLSPKKHHKTGIDKKNLRYSTTTNSINKNQEFLDNNKIEELQNNYGEEEDLELQEKYTKDLINKYKLTIPEVNEKIVIVNDETRNVISDVIMENTVYNLINEAVYGETDLTEMPRIYFFANKNK